MGKRNLHMLLVGMSVSTTTMKNSTEAPYKLDIDLPYDPAIPLLRIYLKECESVYDKGICTPMFAAALFIIAKL
jgi:hypothetical protein